MHNIAVGRGRTVRVGPRRGDRAVASVVTYIDHPLDHASVADLINRLRDLGYRRVVTAALTVREEQSFRANGFERARELVLLERPLNTELPAAGDKLKRARRRDLGDILKVDTAAFDPFWAFDAVGIREALNSTPRRLLRITAEQPVAYALSGVAGDRAYLQRLAVHPEAAGKGLGTSLLLDALRWMQRRGASCAFVNTQQDNDRALNLYKRHGFVEQDEGLVILTRDLA